MRVRIVLPEDLRGWVIGKAAERLAEYVPNFGAQVTVGAAPDPSADINHWMSYAFANSAQLTPSTMLITHPDDPFKVRLIRETLKRYVDVGICMSSDTVGQLVAAGTAPASLCYVLFGHDGAVLPRRVVIGITTRLYSDGRKREKFLLSLAKDMDLSTFSFKIFGAGWEDIGDHLARAGALVELDPGSSDYATDYKRIVAAVPTFDYYLYLGMDEGSLGTLDALAAGIGTIVTDQGFHKDLAPALTHRFIEYDDLLRIFRDIAALTNVRLNTAAGLSWNEYARRHVTIWQLVLAGRRDEIAGQLASAPAHGDPVRRPSLEFRLRALSPVRMLSALAHLPALKPAAEWIRRRRRK